MEVLLYLLWVRVLGHIRRYTYRPQLEDYFIDKPDEWVSYRNLNSLTEFPNKLGLALALEDLTRAGFLQKRIDRIVLEKILRGEIEPPEEFDPAEPYDESPVVCEFKSLSESKPRRSFKDLFEQDPLAAPT